MYEKVNPKDRRYKILRNIGKNGDIDDLKQFKGDTLPKRTISEEYSILIETIGSLAENKEYTIKSINKDWNNYRNDLCICFSKNNEEHTISIKKESDSLLSEIRISIDNSKYNQEQGIDEIITLLK